MQKAVGPAQSHSIENCVERSSLKTCIGQQPCCLGASGGQEILQVSVLIMTTPKPKEAKKTIACKQTVELTTEPK